MPDRRSIPVLLLALVLTAGCAGSSTRRGPAWVAEKRAVEFLQREVPAWSRENGCFSCHNNGDAARALFAASRLGYRVPSRALADTTTWVAQPGQWDHNKGEPGFINQPLANIQFAGALIAAAESGRVSAPAALQAAARRVAADQDADGAWHIEPQNALGSPATYGPALATYLARQILQTANTPQTSEALRRADQWLSRVTPRNVPAAATLLLASVENIGTPAASAASLDFLRRARNQDGGWGPYPDSPSEPFDTALVLLALAKTSGSSESRAFIERGRRFLMEVQQPDGSWPPTTRPSGGTSYAQRLSTTGWATLALLATRP